MERDSDEDQPAVADEVLVFLGRNANGDILVDLIVRMDDGNEQKASRLVPTGEIQEPGKTLKAALKLDIA